jgi:hypothetical protein
MDGLVADYLRRLQAALGRLPAGRRRQLVAEIAEHLGEARAGLDASDEIALREVLDRLGRPEDIAAEAVSGLVERPGRRRGPIVVVGAAMIVLVACLIAALLIGRPAGSASASAKKPVVASLTLPNAVGRTDSAAATQLEAIGVVVVFEPDPNSTAPAGTVTGEQPKAGSRVAPGSTVTLTYVAPASPTPTAPTTASAPPQAGTAPPASSNVAVQASSGPLTPTAPSYPAGIYVDGQLDEPHYFVVFNSEAQGMLGGAVDYEYQDGQTAVAFTFNGTMNGSVLTLYPTNVQTQPAGEFQITAAVPSVISATGDHGGFTLGQCGQYLPAAQSMADCDFTLSSSQ